LNHQILLVLKNQEARFKAFAFGYFTKVGMKLVNAPYNSKMAAQTHAFPCIYFVEIHVSEDYLYDKYVMKFF